MSKLAGKFLISLSAILLAVTLFSLYLNSNFIQRYFLYREKQDLKRISVTLAQEGGGEATIAALEAENDVVIVQLENNTDNDALNADLREALLRKGLTLGGYGNFWLWDQDWRDAVETGSKIRLYEQTQLPYGLLMQYVSLGEDFYAIAKIIPAMEQTISLINLVTACVFSAAALVMILLVYFLVKKITTPLIRIGETAKAIAQLDFQTVEVKTGDELELLARDINDMSSKLKTAHRELEAKNRQMESLLANVSHDLKTPVSLIKAYADGMKDGMDDGSFLDTIIRQNETMERMIQGLLDLAALRRQAPVVESLDVSALLCAAAEPYEWQARERGLTLLCTIEPAIKLDAEREALGTIFDNLLSNVVKYAWGTQAFVTLRRAEGKVVFAVENAVNQAASPDPERLWEPFYVGEESRNKGMSGTGLGLAMVREAAQKCGYDCTGTLAEGRVRFTIQLH